MNALFYNRLALTNIQKNYRFFIPRNLSEIGLVSCFYIALTLALDNRLSSIKGGNYVPYFMILGAAVLALLSIVIMFYVNSFLMKQRKHEFGLYNILGMEKRHISKVLFAESMISSISSILLGLVCGVLFYKLCSLFICKLLGSTVIIGLYFITPKTLIPAGLFFLLIDWIIYIMNCITLGRMNVIELMNAKGKGEKEPKVKWMLLVLGTIALGTGYYIALTIQSPLQAIYMFFIAVFCVIIGTYFLFVSGSIFILKVLKNNPKYYYQKNHMPAISGLLYRMKQNAVGLASITILATGVLVMLSTTVSLYAGMSDTLARHYPEHLYVNCTYEDDQGKTNMFPTQQLVEILENVANNNGVKIKSIDTNQNYLNVSYLLEDHRLYTTGEKERYDFEDICSFTFISQDTYNHYNADNTLNLQPGAIAICSITTGLSPRDITGNLVIHGKDYQVINIPTFPIAAQSSITYSYGIVVENEEVLNEIYQSQKEAYGLNCSEMTNDIAVVFDNLQLACDQGEAISSQIYQEIKDSIEYNHMTVKVDSYWDAKEAVLGMYGVLLFLGILLGIVCLFATVLIIYYKQISEGYEDRDRFQIMHKIGMSSLEVKKTINTQVLLVFFLPLIVAGIHMCIAFPILNKLLLILQLSKTTLFIIVALVTYCIFAFIYTLIYILTSKTYYKIVY